ncbi:transglutaminase domain-containing protein [Paenibacillus lemnae]|uniref:Transglutaminase domain-containing protein n=1 Tax=Paenibacillus lemnae TaxID=1330551 RepID=A0A848M5K2_PAELE|nr:transglutaminase domain-containing protein [Paenibacillus lemnae]NMO94884.1 transglutaminase domain-containing protein [Paenibacillus lemnae]
MRQQRSSSWLFHGLTILWIWILLTQWVSYTEPILYEETTAGIVAALAITAVVEVLVFVKRVYRIPIQLILIIYAVYRILSNYGMPVPESFADALNDERYHYALPYLWFALAAWAIFNFVSVWANSKRKILMLVGLNIVAFAVLDSFTTFVLWDETAWVAGAGLAWLVTEHFNRFRIRFPQGWQRLRRYPFKIIGNILVIFSLIMFAGVNMPNIQPSLTDPYTAWREWSGLPLTSGGGAAGGGVIVTSWESMSGYGREDNDLGGGFNFDYSPVMSISSDERNYWRGETRSVYSGTGWADRQRARDTESVEVGQALPEEQSGVPTKTVKQDVTMLNDNVYPVLFGAYSMVSVDRVDSEENGVLRWKTEGAELHLISEPKRPYYPKTYTVTSEVPVIPWEQLKEKSDEELYGNNSADDEYLQIPSRFPDRVQELAEDITSGGDTPYKKVMLLQQYLQSSEFSYTNSPNLSNKQSGDFVDSFLFEVKEGYCDYFSTSMVMMARSLDIPARWVKGYAPGNVPNEQFMSPGGSRTPSGSYTVTNADAHSWAEVYFGEEYGWIPIEATPGFTMPILSGGEVQEPVVPEEPDEQEPVEEEEQETAAAETAGDDNFNLYPILGIAAGVIILLWIGYILWRMRVNFRFIRARLTSGRPLTPADKVIAETERWIRSIHRKGLTRSPEETLRESVLRWKEHHPSLAPLLNPLLKRFEDARYSPVQVDHEAWKTVQAEAAELKKGLKKVKTV